ncbi:hypothetical protein PtA15_10A616 [Puccinia triticina]|uniref:Uncharacterized protein n=1 Tax=Puccinia triticina TaxID=208348 RepID=A0ABY7CYW2_9BASI|nr:uncharacterized protein PtA15_10A616 [Puccinia triticina]WAQ89192.1 hypothetical protein PtA15_10A616 [Puccinia triticina]
MPRSILRSGSLAVYVILAIYLTNTPAQWSSASLIKRSFGAGAGDHIPGMTYVASDHCGAIAPAENGDAHGQLATAAYNIDGREDSLNRKT